MIGLKCYCRAVSGLVVVGPVVSFLCAFSHCLTKTGMLLLGVISTFLCLSACVSVDPPDGDCWQVVCKKGFEHPEDILYLCRHLAVHSFPVSN